MGIHYLLLIPDYVILRTELSDMTRDCDDLQRVITSYEIVGEVDFALIEWMDEVWQFKATTSLKSPPRESPEFVLFFICFEPN